MRGRDGCSVNGLHANSYATGSLVTARPSQNSPLLLQQWAWPPPLLIPTKGRPGWVGPSKKVYKYHEVVVIGQMDVRVWISKRLRLEFESSELYGADVKNSWLWWNWKCVTTWGELSAVLDTICRSALSANHTINKYTRHNVLRFDQWSCNFRFHGRHKNCTYFRSAARAARPRCCYKGRSVCLSVRHTRDSSPNSSRYRHIGLFHTTR